MELENVLTRVTSRSLVKRKKQTTTDELVELKRANRNLSVMTAVNTHLKLSVNRAIRNLDDNPVYHDEIRVTYARTIEVIKDVPYRCRINFTFSNTPVILTIKYKDEGDLRLHSTYRNGH